MTFYRFSVTFTGAHMRNSNLAPVVQKLDNAIQGINHNLVDSTIGSQNTYPLDSDLSNE